MPNAAEMVRDAVLERQLILERYATREVRAVLEILERAHSSIIAKIATTRGPGTKAWLQMVLAEVDAQYEAASGEMALRLEPMLPGVASLEAKAALAELRSLELGVTLQGPALTTILSSIRSLPADSGSTLDELYKKFDDNARSRLTAAIRQGFVEGETLDQLTRRVRGRAIVPARWTGTGKNRVLRPGRYEDGVIPTTTRGAEMLVRTTVSHIANVARSETYAENADVVKGLQWVATLDPSTCPSCGSIDGKVWGLDEKHPTPPAHPNCRCVLTPILRSWKELGIDKAEIPETTRASMDGQVPAVLKFGAWLKTRSPEVQDDILGKGKGRLFRAGVALGKIAPDGRELSLKELEARYG